MVFESISERYIDLHHLYGLKLNFILIDSRS